MPNVSILTGTRPQPANALVTADQDTIIGSGTVDDPLRGGPGASGSTFDAELLVNGIGPGPHVDPKGLALMVTDGGGTVEAVDLDGSIVCVGLLTAAAESGETVRVQSAGPFTMTAAEWDQVIQGGSPSGLSPGATYFASDSVVGKIKTALFGPGDLALQIGVAINATTLILQLAPPVVIS